MIGPITREPKWNDHYVWYLTADANPSYIPTGAFEYSAFTFFTEDEVLPEYLIYFTGKGTLLVLDGFTIYAQAIENYRKSRGKRKKK
jgi:hypothetical protein